MGNSICLKVTIELLSDAIFGCGFSIPAEEDISVKKDRDGYPVLGGQTFKGLLRESMTDYIDWTGGNSGLVDTLLGTEGFTEIAGARHINLTDFAVAERYEDPEDYFVTRAFTAIEDGLAKEGSLRLAECIVRGTRFEGTVHCMEEDKELLIDSLLCLKWLGTMRNRGFGRVKVSAEEAEFDNRTEIRGAKSAYVKYEIETLAPVCLTDLAKSHGTFYETKSYIPGSAIRGMIINRIAAIAPERLEENKSDLLQKMSVGNAIPSFSERPSIPAPKGFYEAKDGSNFENILYIDDLTPGNKRASLGCAAALTGNIVKYYVPQTDGAMCMNRRLTREDKQGGLYEKRWIGAGEKFAGYICIGDSAAADVLQDALTEEVIWIGASQGSGFGKCGIKYTYVDEPDYFEYGVADSEETVNEFTMMAFSPIAMLDEYGEPCGINIKELEDKLGLDAGSLKIEKSSTSVSSYQGYNRKWGVRTEAERMYDAGSMFLFRSSMLVSKHALYKLQCEGVGIRKPEGYGQVLIIEGLDVIEGKEPIDGDVRTEDKAAVIRRKEERARVIQKLAETIPSGLSKSQIGSLQALLEERYGNDEAAMKKIDDFYEHNSHKKPEYAAKYEKMKKFTDKFLDDKKYSEAIENDSVRERMKLLADAFNYSRKGER